MQQEGGITLGSFLSMHVGVVFQQCEYNVDS